MTREQAGVRRAKVPSQGSHSLLEFKSAIADMKANHVVSIEYSLFKLRVTECDKIALQKSFDKEKVEWKQ